MDFYYIFKKWTIFCKKKLNKFGLCFDEGLKTGLINSYDAVLIQLWYSYNTVMISVSKF